MSSLLDKSEGSLANFDFFEVPDLWGVLLNSSIAAEFACSQSIQNWHFGPFFLIQVSFVNLFLRLDVRLEVWSQQVPVIIVHDCSD